MASMKLLLLEGTTEFPSGVDLSAKLTVLGTWDTLRRNDSEKE